MIEKDLGLSKMGVMVKEKVFLITGATRGIGLSIYRKCVEMGGVAVICSRSSKDIDLAVSQVDPKRMRSMGVVADVSREEGCEQLVSETLNKYGRVDVLVNNAGIIGPVGPVERNEAVAWRSTFEVNIFGTMYCCQLVLPGMKARHGGKIINMAGAGVGGTRPMGNFTAYYASKAAVVAFTEALAAEVRGDNIQVNCVSPGGVNTYLTDYILTQGRGKVGDEVFDQMLRQKESGGESPDLGAEMVMFLASQKADHLTGRVVSAKWDSRESLLDPSIGKNRYTLRRIDGVFFDEKEK